MRSIVIVIAWDEPEATRLIRQYLDNNGLKDEEIELDYQDLDETAMVWADSGDY